MVCKGSIRTLFLSVIFSGAAITSSLHAQQGSDRPPDTPDQAGVKADAALNPKLPTVFIVGDSTARNGADLGWGDHFAQFFDTRKINVANRAIAGRSSRTYITEGHWQKVVDEMKPGDFLLLQMGHNDPGDLAGAKPRGSLKGIGDDTQNVPQTAGPYAGKTETIHTYGWYMKRMIDDAKANNVHVMLLTTTVRNIWTGGHIERDMGYDGYIRQIGVQENVPVLDMGACEADYFEKIGQARTAAMFPKDHTHTSPDGADRAAACAAYVIHSANVPLGAFLRGATPSTEAAPAAK